MRQAFSYTTAQTHTGYSFRVRRTPVRYAFSNADTDLRGGVSYRFRVRRCGYVLSHPIPGGRGRYRFRCGFFGDILREIPPPAFMMPTHEALYDAFYTALMPPEHETKRSPAERRMVPKRRREADNRDIASALGLPVFCRVADSWDIHRQSAANHCHSAVFGVTEYTLSPDLLSVLTAVSRLLAPLVKEAGQNNAGTELERIVPDAFTTGGTVLERTVPQAFTTDDTEPERVVPGLVVTGADSPLEPPNTRDGISRGETPLLSGDREKNVIAKSHAAALLPDRRTEAEYDQRGGEELERVSEHELATAVLHLLTREVFYQGVTETELAGVCVRLIETLRDMTEPGFIRTIKESASEELLTQLERLIQRSFTVSHGRYAETIPHKSVLVKTLLKALEKTGKAASVLPEVFALSHEPEKAALREHFVPGLDKTAEHTARSDELIYMALWEYMRSVMSEPTEQTAVKSRRSEVLHDKTVALTNARLKSALMSAEKLLTASRTGLVDLENERELKLWSRLWFIRGEGETDRIIVPSHDFDYNGSPITFEGFDDLIPENYSVVYPETLRRGVLSHPIPEGAELALREIPTAISVMTEMISVLILMWSRFYRAFWGWTGTQAVLGLFCFLRSRWSLRRVMYIYSQRTILDYCAAAYRLGWGSTIARCLRRSRSEMTAAKTHRM